MGGEGKEKTTRGGGVEEKKPIEGGRNKKKKNTQMVGEGKEKTTQGGVEEKTYRGWKEQKEICYTNVGWEEGKKEKKTTQRG